MPENEEIEPQNIPPVLADGIELTPAGDDDAVDAEFTEEKRAPPAPAMDDRGAVRAELVDEKPSEFDLFLASLPKDQDVSVMVRRLADNNLKFRRPCPAGMNVETIVWGGQSQGDIENDIRARHGGGRYYFQLRYGTGINKGWPQILADPAEPSLAEITERGEKAKTDEPQRTEQFAPVPTPPVIADDDEMVDKFFAKMEKYQAFMDKLRPPAPPPVPMAASDPIRDRVLLAAFEAKDNPLSGDVVRSMLKINSDRPRDWFDYVTEGADALPKLAAAAKEILPMAAPLLGGLFGIGGGPSSPRMPVMPGGMVVPAQNPQTANKGPVMPPDDAQGVPAPETQPAATQTSTARAKTVDW